MSRARNPGKGAFKRCVEAVSKRKGVYSPSGVCAAAGRQKYGKKKFAAMAKAGRKLAAKPKRNIWPFSSLSSRQMTPARGGAAAHLKKGGGSRSLKQSEYKGYRITPTAEGFRAMDSEFDTLKDAKRFIDAWVKRNPVYTLRKKGLFSKHVPFEARDDEHAKRKVVRFAGRTGKTYDLFKTDYEGKLKRGNPKRKKRNPADAAASAFREFHGRDSDKVATVTRKVHSHRHLTAAGTLRGLKVAGVDGRRHNVRDFGGALLAFNERKNQLFIEGGDQSINLSDYGIRDPHELETLGRVTHIDYFADKRHLGSEGGRAVYRHKFRTTNENGKHVTIRIARYPDLIYRVRDKHLEFSGGSYEIRREGIDK